MSALAQVSAQSVERTRRSVATMTVWWHVARSAARDVPPSDGPAPGHVASGEPYRLTPPRGLSP